MTKSKGWTQIGIFNFQVMGFIEMAKKKKKKIINPSPTFETVLKCNAFNLLGRVHVNVVTVQFASTCKNIHR